MKSILRICIPAVGLLTTMATAQQNYTITDLKPAPGGNFSQGFSVSNPGVIGGQSNTSDAAQRAAFWLKALNLPPAVVGASGVNSAVFGVNERGQAEVQSEVNEQDPNAENFCGYGTNLKCQPFRWQSNVLTPLPLLGGNNGAVGGINSTGEIVGWAEQATIDPACVLPQTLDFEAVAWLPGESNPRLLRPLSSDTVSMALWINDNGVAVGTSGTCADTGLLPFGHGAHPVIWDRDGSPLNIGMTNPAEEFGGIALGINNEGQVVGAATLPDGSQTAFLWGRFIGMRKLLPLPGNVISGAVSINGVGDAVGQSFDVDGFPSPVIWRNGGPPTNLNDLAPGSPLFLLWPTSINARGEITGFGVTATGDIHGFLAVPKGTSANAGSATNNGTRPPILSETARGFLRNRFGVRIP